MIAKAMKRKNMLKVGLTGGIASGKNIISDYFGTLGAPIYDTDLISRELTVFPNDGFQAILSLFGKNFLVSENEIDRNKIKRHIFSNPSEKARLESVLHPLIHNSLTEQLKKCSKNYCIIVVPLLFETNFIELMDTTIVAHCSKALQLKRLIARDKIEKELAIKIIESQASEDERVKKADVIVDTEKNIIDIHNQITELHHRFTKIKND